ncbi:STM2901 family protein [Paraburkholderia sediminicola]|uniref:STM2901 family protein n=1 Tax=Paraburkholderia sediminicola TaxID=458836 RepID=UPI0038B6CF9C
MSDTYSYGSHKDLEPTELFLFIAVDQTCEQLGINDVESVILILSGLPILPTRAKPLGATKGTSVASVMSRSLFRYELKKKVLPTFTLRSIKRLRWVLTHKLGVFIGRTLPGVGWILLANDVYQIAYQTVVRYNRMVLPADRVF